MGAITIKIKDKIEKEYLESVKEEKCPGKGKLGEAVGEALWSWAEQQKQKHLAQELTQMMKEGFSMGQLKVKGRDGLYE
ncbi:hypothetical protein HYU14_05665 [Candidatus Woesearchaeota archaeon]|nr:hypothetical protein [Candidatus Woesearchaeota archaeon]